MAEAHGTTPGLAVIGAEYRALDEIPPRARVFGMWDQAALWFGAASLPAAWLYGAIMAGWTGLGGALLLILGVSPLVLVPWALLGYIAARTGGASVAILRPAFGLRGSALPAAFYLVFGFGWAAVNVFVCSIGTSFIFKGLFSTPALGEPGYQGPMAASILVTCVVQGLFAVAGHRAIRVMAIVATVGLALLGGYETYLAFRSWSVVDLFAWRPAQTLTTSVGPFNYTITLALLIVLVVATVATNAGNIYASALGMSQLAPRSGLSIRALLAIAAAIVVPLSLLPLVAGNLLGSYIFFLDFVGALVVPLWTIVLVDYFLVRRGRYSSELFRVQDGAYWYGGGIHWPGVVSLFAGTAVYWIVAFAFPQLRSTITATVPTVIVAGGLHLLTARRNVPVATRQAHGTFD